MPDTPKLNGVAEREPEHTQAAVAVGAAGFESPRQFSGTHAQENMTCRPVVRGSARACDAFDKTAMMATAGSKLPPGLLRVPAATRRAPIVGVGLLPFAPCRRSCSEGEPCAFLNGGSNDPHVHP